MARRGPLHDIELVEDDEPDVDVLDADVAGGPPPGRPRRRTPLVVGAAVLALVLVVAVVGQTVVDRRERARIAALADVPGVVAPLDGPPSPLWEASFEDVAGGAVRAGDVLVGVTDTDQQGPVEVAGRDVRTGAELWRVTLIDGAQRPATDSGPVGGLWAGSCTGEPDHEDVVVCLVYDGEWVDIETDGDGMRSELVASEVRVVTLDARDGSVLTDLTSALDLGDTAGSFVVLGDLVAAVAPAGDDVEVRAVTTDGTPAWRTTVRAGGEERQVFLTTLGDLVAAVSETELTLLDASGHVERTLALDRAYVTGTPGVQLMLVPAPAGYERTAGGETVARRTTTTVLRPGATVEVTGEPVWLTVDDGSVPGLVLTTDGQRLTAWDGDGRELWDAEVRADGVMVLDGRVHLEDGLDVLTLDARTGAELWRSDVVTGMPVTDGQHLLGVATAPARGRRAEIVALDPADGSERWRGPLPDGTVRLEEHHHLLLAVGSEPADLEALDEQYRVLG